MNEKEFLALLNDLEFVRTEEEKLEDLGVNIINTPMVQKLWNIVYDLLGYIFSDEIAENVIDNVYNPTVDKQTLWKKANE